MRRREVNKVNDVNNGKNKTGDYALLVIEDVFDDDQILEDKMLELEKMITTNQRPTTNN